MGEIRVEFGEFCAVFRFLRRLSGGAAWKRRSVFRPDTDSGYDITQNCAETGCFLSGISLVDASAVPVCGKIEIVL